MRFPVAVLCFSVVAIIVLGILQAEKAVDSSHDTAREVATEPALTEESIPLHPELQGHPPLTVWMIETMVGAAMDTVECALFVNSGDCVILDVKIELEVVPDGSATIDAMLAEAGWRLATSPPANGVALLYPGSRLTGNHNFASVRIRRSASYHGAVCVRAKRLRISVRPNGEFDTARERVLAQYEQCGFSPEAFVARCLFE